MPRSSQPGRLGYTNIATAKWSLFGKRVCLWLLILPLGYLSGCLSGVWTGASLVYDRHNVYKKLGDLKLAATLNQKLFKDNRYHRADVNLEIAVFNGDVLLVGIVPTATMRSEIHQQLQSIKGIRRLFNQIAVSHKPVNALQDSWITGQIRSLMIANSSIDPATFKVVTYQNIVYVLGDVDPQQAKLVIDIAKQCSGVVRVVCLLQYYHLSNKSG